jgi:hypothetical protein
MKITNPSIANFILHQFKRDESYLNYLELTDEERSIITEDNYNKLIEELKLVDHIITPWVTHKKSLNKICAELIQEFLKSELNYSIPIEDILSKYSFKKFLKGEGSGYCIYKVINSEKVEHLKILPAISESNGEYFRLLFKIQRLK